MKLMIKVQTRDKAHDVFTCSKNQINFDVTCKISAMRLIS